MPLMESRRLRLQKVEQWKRLGRLDPDVRNFSCLRLSDEEERLLTWLHSPTPTEPVLVELGDRVLPAVKLSVDNGIFALYVMDCDDGPSLESSMVFAGLYDPKALTLYVDQASSVLADLPFASSENLQNAFMEAATFAFECVAEQMESAPDLLRGMSRDVWDVFRRAYPTVLHEAFVYGGTPQDVIHIYTDALVSELAPDWSRDLAAAYLADEQTLISKFLQESVPDEAYALGACACNSVYGYWNHLEEHEQHPAHRLRTIAAACKTAIGEFVHFDLINHKTNRVATIVMPKFYFADGAYGAFDTRRWPGAVRDCLKGLFPDSFGCFHVSDILRARDVSTGQLLYEAPDAGKHVCASAWDTLEDARSVHGDTLLPGF